MFKEKYLSKLIFAVPILFIILTSTFITFIHIKKVDDKFLLDTKNLKENFIDEKKHQIDTVLQSINSYIF